MTTTSILSRRTLVASAAVLPALAVPALASVDNPDAELLRLGAEFEQVEQEWLARRALDRKWAKAADVAQEAAGLPRKKHSDFSSDEETAAYNKKRSAVHYEGKEEEEADLNVHGGSIAWDRINDRVTDLIDQILEHQPTTAAGAGVLMRAFVLSNEEWWSTEDGYAGQEEYDRVRAFLNPICAALNVKPAPIQEAELIAQEEA